MLQPEYPTSVQNAGSLAEIIPSPADTFKSLKEFVHRQYPVIAVVFAIAIAMGIIYILTTPPSYTASATMIIDTKRVNLFQQQSMFSDMPLDGAAVESQVELLKSENIALAVIKQLRLTEDPEFVHPGGGLFGTLLSGITGLFSFTPDEPSSEFALTRAAVSTFESRLTIRRVGLSYIINIFYKSLSADRAAEIANGVAEAYVNDQLEAKYQAARRAGSWLQDRLRELREQASSAERIVVAYKNKNDMVDAGGRTINEQQLAELNSELVVARSRAAEASAKVDRVRAVLGDNSPEATVTATVADTLKNEVITKLRSQYLDLSRHEADWSVRYGSTHLAVVNVRNQMREIQNSIRNELQRIAETYKSDLEIAKQNEENVQRELSQAVSQSQVTNQAQVGLRELESNAQTYRALYDNFLQRYMESVQQQSFPITEARVISAATRPLSKSDPKTFLVLGLATIVGLAFGGIAGFWRDFADRVFRTSGQLETALQTQCIALIPFVKEPGAKDEITDVGHEVKPAGEKREIKLVKDVKLRDAGQQTIARVPGFYSTIVESPFSAFTESIRSIKLAADLSPSATGGKIIGFTSSVPAEGKSSIATSLARLTAHTGARTLLIDADLRNPSLTRLLSPKAACGLMEVIRGQATLEKAIWVDQATNMSFLPGVVKSRMAHSSEILASPQMRKFVNGLRDSYDYIIVDFSPLMPIVDVRASTDLVDAYVFVVEWGKTRTDYVEQALRSSRGVYEHLLGVVLNKVNLRSMGRYDGRGGSYYYHGNYSRYGYTE